MTKSSPAPADHWAVSARASGGIVAAGVTLPNIELSLLGIPPGFTEPEIQTWLRDLAGVAIETSRSDHRSRPIPPLLHHALTGLLFSQSELWSHTGHPLPFAAVFVHDPQGVAFGWVGRARAVLLVNGEPHEPQWVIVRDESGQEAMSASLPADAHVLLTLEYWPAGETGSPAPATIDAEFGAIGETPAAAASALAEAATSGIEIDLGFDDDVPEIELNERSTSAESAVTQPEAPRSPTAPTAGPLTGARSALPTEQPGLAPDPTGMRFADSEGMQKLPSTKNPSAETFSMPQVPRPEPRTELNERRVASEFDEPESAESADEPGHPVGRWLQKLMGFGRKRDDATDEPEAPPPRPQQRPAPAPAAARPAAPRPAAPLRPPPLHAQPAPRVEASDLSPPPLPVPIDIQEPHAMPDARALPSPAGRTPPSSTPTVHPPAPAPTAAAGGLAAAGMSEILGALKKQAAAAPPASGRSMSAPATSAPQASAPAKSAPPASRPPATGKRTTGPAVAPPGGPVAGPSLRARIPEEPAPVEPPFPVLEVKPRPDAPAEAPRGPIHIDHEPVGADTTFAIPKLPPRGGAQPPAQPPARAGSPPPGTLATPPGGRMAPPPRPAAPAPPPALTKPTKREGDVPEPPTEFLERFAASMRVAPGLDPTPQEEVAPPREPSPPAPRTPAASARTGGPPPLPSARRAAAQLQRPLIPPTAETPIAPAAPVDTRRPEWIPETPAEPTVPWTPTGIPIAGSQQPIDTPTTAPILRAPSERTPVPVAESEMGALLRELPLGGPAAAGDDPGEVPDGMLVAQPAKARPRTWRRGEWPELDELEQGPPPFWRRPWVVAAFIAVMLGIGWIVGHSQAPDNDVHATPMTRVLRTVGLGGARFTADIDTDPPGAWIAIDGKDLGRRTPSTLELLPGVHALTLSMPDLGEVKVDLKGKRGQKVKVNEALHGSLDVVASDPSLPVQMSLDGSPQGYLPVHVTKLPPGLHELQFSGPRMQPWAQNVNVGIRKNTKVVSKPMLSPATGVVQVLAQMNDENGSAPLSGATVYVDGEIRGTTPTTIELPRGPHSLRAQFEGVTAPIQVLDLPGGNKRFATFQFGVDSDLPPLKLEGATQKLLSKNPAVVSATLDGLEADDLREAWLHLLTPDGLWSRFPMTISAGDRGAVLNVSFPVSQFNGEQKATWYLSAATKQGDDFFTEMQRSGR